MIIKGQKINDRYQIIRTIGEGGMANVYLAYDTILDRNVAVKILRGDLANDEKFVRRFQREAIAASSLSHPNIVEMYDVGEDDGRYFIVMEYVEGVTLKSLIKRRGSLTLTEVIDIMLQLTSGIACAHESFIIHRDIKPQNVMILDDGRVKITDFGIAMALNSNELTQTNSVMGSVHYLPPEQANGTGSTIKSDIYSLGILMYELLTGKLPFKGENAVEIAIKHMKEPIPSITEFNPEIPQCIENIILKASAKNPKNRYENVMEMHEDLKTCLDEGRKDEKKYAYQYPDFENEDSKKKVSRVKKNVELANDPDFEKKNKKVNIAIIIITIIAVLIGLGIVFGFIIYPALTEEKDLTIPDVSKMSVVNAELALREAGFEVNTTVSEEFHETIEKDEVIKTSPGAGRTVKEGTVITLIVSLGSEKMEMEDYTGSLYESAKAILELKGLVVIKEDKEVTAEENIKEGTIVEQDVKAGTKLEEGDTIIFKVAKLMDVYPDFVNEDYSLSGVETFCEEKGVNLQITYKETNDYPEGKIITQSRAAGSKVVSGVNLRITVAKKIAVQEPVEDKEDKKETDDDKKVDITPVS